MPEPPMSTPNACAVSIIFDLSYQGTYGYIEPVNAIVTRPMPQKRAENTQVVNTIA